jgi:hypothetical protein
MQHHFASHSSNNHGNNAYPSRALEFTPSFSGVSVTRSFVLCVCFVDRCLTIVLFVFLRLTDEYDYPFGIFNPFFNSEDQQLHQYH